MPPVVAAALAAHRTAAAFLLLAALLFGLPGLPGLGPLALPAARAADADALPAEWKAAAGPHTVTVRDEDWTDAKRRDRSVPVRLYLPGGDGPFPIIVFSHGLGGTRDGYEFLGQHWASHGYAVVHPQHIGSDESVWKGNPEPMKALHAAIKDPRNSLNRPQDISFVMDELTRRNALRGDPLAGRLDLAHAGIGGHSYGGFTTLAIAGQRFAARGGILVPDLMDKRFKAALPLSSPVGADPDTDNLDQVFGDITIPSLHMTGTKDKSPIGDTTAEQRRLPYDHSLHAQRYLVTFTNGDHMVFSGRDRKFGAAKRLDDTVHPLILMSSTAFWDAYLRDDTVALRWLQSGPFATRLGTAGIFEQATPMAE